jgi:fatty acid synthase subunit beta
MNEQASVRKAVYADAQKDKELEGHQAATASSTAPASHSIRPRANINVQFPPLPSKERLEQLKHVKGMVDMERVVVVTGKHPFSLFSILSILFSIDINCRHYV